VPVWHAKTKEWVKAGRLAVVGVAQEQHPDRCRLWLQWQKIPWPVLHDPITKTGLTAVPLLTAIDEWGVVRLTNPDLDTFEREFLERDFPKPVSLPETGPASPPDPRALLAEARAKNSADAWRAYGDSVLLFGPKNGQAGALEAYRHAVTANPADGASHFRLGVAYRMRYDSPARQGGDFQAALDAWGAALALDPNQYIWRRRIQQYGPRLDKPYPFYDWVDEGRAAIRARGETPVALAAEPTGAETAAPLKELSPAAPVPEPDPRAKVTRDTGRFVRIETALAPGSVKPGEATRLHFVFRVNPARKAHWNNEAEPLRVWLDVPPGWETEQRLIEAPNPQIATSSEVRQMSVELRAPKFVPTGPATLSGYALYNVCEDVNGVCLFRRQDVRVRIQVVPPP